MYTKIPKFAGYRRRDVIDFVKLMLLTNYVWAWKAVAKLTEVTRREETDGVGFSAWDRPYFNYWYERIFWQGPHLPKDIKREVTRRIRKYAIQLINISDGTKLNIAMDKYYKKHKKK